MQNKIFMREKENFSYDIRYDDMEKGEEKEKFQLRMFPYTQ